MSEQQTFAQFLKENSRDAHDSVDNLVMSVKPFDNKDNYVKFLQLQAVFHKIVDNIYKDTQLNQQINNLAELARYDAVVQDLQDLNAAEAKISVPLPTPNGAEAIGWLYCAEGSNVGAAFLFKDAQTKLGFDATHGARHLGAHPDGRGKHWREFVVHLNNLKLNVDEQKAALTGALNAFAFYKVLLHEIFQIA